MEDETSKSVEAGFKASLLDNKATFNLSVFQQKFKNFTVISPQAIQFLCAFPVASPACSAGQLASGGTAGFTNSFALVNPVKVTGFEAEFGYRPSDRFSIGGNFAYAKSKVKNGRVPCVDLNNDNFQDADAVTAATAALLVAQAGAALVDTCAISSASPAPHFSANVQGEYNVLFGSNEGYLRGLLNYNGKTRGDDVNPVDSVSSYALINMYAGVRHEDGNWDVGVYVKNLTNTHRVLTRNGTRATSTIANASYVSDYYQISTTAPREFGLSFRVAFGSR
jgi:iron complex outermembrane recepter protein